MPQINFNHMRNIIFIHGNASSSRVFDPIIKEWHSSPQLVSFDLPGHGNAASIISKSWNSNKSFLLDKINALEGDKLLLGNSLGGMYVTELAPQVESLKGVVLIGSAPLKKPLNFEEAFLPNPYSNSYLKECPEENEIAEAANACVSNESIVPILVEDFYRTDTKARRMILDCVSNPDVFLNQADIFNKLQCHKYILCGTHDPIVNLNYLKKLKNEVVHPFELIEMNDCGHYPSIEKPKEFTKLLERISDEVFL